MKKLTFLLPIFAVALMVGCSKDADLAPNQNQDKVEQIEGEAFLSLVISKPESRADDPDQAGTAEESTVDVVKVIAFTKEYDYVGTYDPKTVKGNNKFVFMVSPQAYRFFAFVNPTADMTTALGSLSGNWNTVESKLQTILSLGVRADIATYTTDNLFPMVSAGSYDNGTMVESVLVRPADDALDNGKLSTDEANPTVIKIKVDRMVSKFSAIAKTGADLVVEDDRTDSYVAGDPKPVGEVLGVRLNVVNKHSYIYSHIIQANDNADDYRRDPNMKVGNSEAKPHGQETDLTKNFFWLHNYQNPTFNAPTAAASTEYVFENTADGGYFNYNNLTQLMVKAKYIPTGQPDPDNLPAGYTTALTHKPEDKGTWFAIAIKGFGTMQMTFEGLIDYYEANRDGDVANGVAQDLDVCAKMNRQLQHMLASAVELNGLTAATAEWDDAGLNIDVLNSIPNGGYVAATVPNEEDYIVQFYQFGHNYYDIFIQHDSDVDKGQPGRWGMVRNNHYTLSINKITGPGYPYIPDPTDPEIKDPQNPDPKDPEPADEGMAFIEATIEVNPWTMWSQDVELN